ncbi:hypothetical protein JRO89_XS06G0137700 [Xanthoceras sorbifolium]|uniref:Protein FAR1-RELATED SEQUENCE n=1 Tax=Xanthoceras sorbifolium TaxID=99658 RepID=A0ABQ8HY39_9ROSI|nr:hypothetical protein JRO89_XS06G0137700 [Xanthoceras sorbifolium]
MKTTSLPMDGLTWAKVAITDIVAEMTNHEQNLREPQSVAFLPSHYILKRWTKAAKYDTVIDDKGTEISDFQDKSMLTRRTRLFQLASNVIENVVGSEKASKILENDLNNVLSKVKSVVRSDSISKKHSSTSQIYNEPLAVKAKGCEKRLKGGKEKAKGKTTDNSRHCNGCEKVGQSHDKRNCPLINNRGEDLR